MDLLHVFLTDRGDYYRTVEDAKVKSIYTNCDLRRGSAKGT